MITTCNVASFRKLTPAMLASQHLAQANDIVATTKGAAAIALKKAAPALGITGTAYHILDILIGLTKADDWRQGRRPLVAISNEKLAEYVHRSIRTVSRALRQLVEAGVMAYRDSPTGRRYIHRNEGKGGEIQRAFGFDFSPARQRVEELQQIGTAFTEHLNAQKDAKRTITRLKRALEDMADLAARKTVRFAEIDAERLALEGKALDPITRAEALTMIYEAAVTLMETALKDDEMSCAGDINDAPYNHTNSQPHINCNRMRPDPSGSDLKSDNNIRGLANANHLKCPDPDYHGIVSALDKVQICKSQAKSLVQDKGAIVLATGPGLYDRYVANASYCATHEETERAYVVTKDSNHSLIGYTCVVDNKNN